ncbi:MAG: GGDEF domain-containing protein [Elusimicrobia bacterium]|nr:GGDEF domain-containing protein [Elusimicrobiota bacterium]
MSGYFFLGGPVFLLIVLPVVLRFFPRRSGIFQTWLALLAAGFALFILFLFNQSPERLRQAGVHRESWIMMAAVMAAAEIFYFKRFFSAGAFQETRQKSEAQQLRHDQIFHAETEISALKLKLAAEEAKLQESLRFYSTVRDLAECVDFEQMKKVLEREVRQAMPYLSGFVLFVVNKQKDFLEPQIQHKLWLSDEKVQRKLSGQARIEKKPFFYDEAAGREFLVAPILSGEEILGVFAGALETKGAQGQAWPSREEMLVCAATVADELKFGLLKTISFARLEQLSRVDGLTGVFRRGVFDQRLDDEVLRAKTFKTTLGLLFLDVDHFKNINDRWGHPFGDVVLKKITALIQNSLYETDFVARYGGEEFAVLLPRTNEEGALKKAEIIRRRVESEIFYQEDKNTKIGATVSIGVAFFPKDARDAQGLIRAADEALYYCKENGRNKVASRSELNI